VEERQDALPPTKGYKLFLEKWREILRHPRRQELLLEERGQILRPLHEADGQVLLEERHQALLILVAARGEREQPFRCPSEELS
jgi:hypothetical protein